MNKILEFPHKEQVSEQASVWIAKLDRGLTEAEQQALVEWMQQSDEHRQVLFELAGLWDKMDSLARLADLFEAPVQHKVRKLTPVYWAAAASLIITVVAVMWGLAEIKFDSRQLVARVYETAVGEHSKISLPDGSLLVLNTNSRLEVKYTADHRLFLLERGEVNIEVAHDESRPLSVMVGDKIVQAVGTAFNVKINNNKEVELIVTDGKVRVAQRLSRFKSEAQITAERLPENAMAVSQGEKIVLGAVQEKIARIQEVDMAARLSWRQGNLIFRGETLEQALAEISRYTSVEFEVLDESIKHERIAGLFKAGDVNGLLATLAQNFNIESERLGTDKVLLRAR